MAMAMIGDAGAAGAGSSRKRPRSPVPAAASLPVPSPARPDSEICSDSPALAASIRSADPSASAAALNALLRTSADDRANYSLGRGGKDVVDALVETFDGAVRWDLGEAIFEDGADDESDLTPSAATWDDGGGGSGESGPDEGTGSAVPADWSSFCRLRLASPMSSPHIHPSEFVTDADVRTLDVVVVILRNLSYVSANLRYLAHSAGVLRILGGCLYYRAFARPGDEEADAAKFGRGASTSASNHNICVHALHALLNLAPMLDPTGRKVFTDRVLLDPTNPDSDAASVVPHDGEMYGQAKSLGLGGMLIARRFEVRDEALSKIPDDVVRTMMAPLIRAVLSVFPALLHSLDCECNRPVVSCSLEVLSALADNPDHRGAFLEAPDALLSRLVDLLYVPRLGPDSVEYVDPVRNMVSRVPTLKLMMGYDASVDSELRDRSAELLVKLTGLGPDLRRRLGRRIVAPAAPLSGTNRRGGAAGKAASAAAGRKGCVPNARLYDALVVMLTTTTGRGDASQLAAKLLANLATAPENRDGMLYVEAKALQASSRDPQVANVVCNGIFNHMV